MIPRRRSLSLVCSLTLGEILLTHSIWSDNDRPKYTPCYPPMTWIYYIFILCTIIDCVAVVILAALRSGLWGVQTTISPDDLPLRNAYTNLGKLYQDHPSSFVLKTPVYNSPLLVGQVSRYEPDRVFPQPVEAYAEKNAGYSRLVYQHYLLSDQVRFTLFSVYQSLKHPFIHWV